MNKKIFLSLFLIFSLLTVYGQAVEKFIFFNDSYEALQRRAVKSDRPYFLYFYANWCMPAKDMNEKTFTNPTLVNYAMQNYLGIALDGESLITEGADLARKFNVVYYPEILVFSPEGKLLERLNGFQSASALLTTLQRNVNKAGDGTDQDFSDSEYPLIGEDDNEGYLFNVFAHTQKYNGYGLQIGVFKNYRNVFLKILELNEEKYHRNVMVYVKESEAGDDLFKVILGPFFTEEQAAAYQKQIKSKQGLEGILVELDDLDY